MKYKEMTSDQLSSESSHSDRDAPKSVPIKSSMRKSGLIANEATPRWHWILIASLASIIYINSLSCGLAFDDMSAIKDNRDLRPQTPWLQVFSNDFWGTPIRKEQSHKSYRPLSVLTFRLNYAIHELDPLGYHLVNVLLHVLVCILYHRMCRMFMPSLASLVSGLHFAAHPIHSEAVTGIVGRAETLCSIFFITAFLTYARATKKCSRTAWPDLLRSMFLVACATLCKEQGITVIAVCAAYEIFVTQQASIPSILSSTRSHLESKSSLSNSIRESLRRLAFLAVSALLMLVVRLRVMGSQLPVFTKFDNPAAAADTPERQLTFNYLLALNSWLLLFPWDLCCDWTMGTVPTVKSFLDYRNGATILFYAALASLTWKMLTSRRGVTKNVLLLSLAFIVFPFLPASNLLFPVGFVVAERILYLPSMGFSMLVGYGWFLLSRRGPTPCVMADTNGNCQRPEKEVPIRINPVISKVLLLTLVVALASHSARTFLRNYDWESEYTLFMAGLKVTKHNAKLYNNVGHALEAQKRYKEALNYFLEAVQVQPDDVGAHMNVGRCYNHLDQFEMSEGAFRRAKSLLPKPRPGERYQTRVAPSHLNVFLNLGNLIAKDKSRLEEADALYRQAISMRADYTQAYINRGEILIKMNRTREAQEVYEKALQFDGANPDIYYNLGVVLLEQGKPTQALVYFNKALELEPNHEQALMNSAIVIQESGSSQLRDLAVRRLKTLLERGKANERIYFNLGMLAMDIKNHVDGEKWFRAAINVKEDFRSALFNLALLLSESNRPLAAVPFLKQLLKHHVNHVKGLILLGDIYVNHIRDFDAAEECYRNIVRIDPANVQGRHNLCVVYVERGSLEKAEKCLVEVATLAPNEDYVQKHLQIVRKRLAKVVQPPGL